MIEVGSLVRAPRATDQTKTKVTGRALVATIQDDAGTACLIWESMAPTLPQRISSFLIAPVLAEISEEDNEEATVPLQYITELLPFEVNERNKEEANENVSILKDRGDQLLRLGDSSAAIAQYEMALSKSSILQVGSTIVVQIQGYPKIAEVDCIEEGDNEQKESMLDIEVVETGTEMTIRESQVLLCLPPAKDDEKLQERILLNLARCLLQLGNVHLPYRQKYLKAAVLAWTLALTVTTYQHDNDQNSENSKKMTNIPPNGRTALQLRARAYGNLTKWSHALADAKRLINQTDQDSVQVGRKLLQDLQRQQKQHIKSDKKLAKAVCQWVETATTTQEEMAVSNDLHDDNNKRAVHPVQSAIQQQPSTLHPKSTRMTNVSHSRPLQISISYLPIMMALVTAFLIQRYFHADDSII